MHNIGVRGKSLYVFLKLPHILLQLIDFKHIERMFKI